MPFTKDDYRDLEIAAEGLELSLNGPAVSDQRIQDCIIFLSSALHKANVEAGWWSDLETGKPIERNKAELLMLKVSEVVEAHEHEGADEHLPEFSSFRVEMADTAIRLFDTIGAYDLSREASREFAIMRGAYDRNQAARHSNGFEIVKHLARAMEAARKNRMPEFGRYLGAALFGVFDAARYRDMNLGNRYGRNLRDYHTHTLAEPIVRKLAYNAQRLDHKAEHRRLGEGKKF